MYPKQQRTYTYDGLSRMTSEFNPETNPNAYYYTYDTDTIFGASNGDLVKRTDPVGNVTCYAYDALHRLTAVTYPSGSYASITPQKHYVYDSAVVDNATMAYTKGRLAEAYTGTSSAKITDLGFSYTNRGQIAATYESTPNSGGFYTVVNGYWPDGSLYSRWISGTPAWYYWPDGEGRHGFGVPESRHQHTYNGFSEATAVTYGSGDSDSFGYDPNTGRMTGYTYTVGGKTVTGALTWNANGTLKTLGITDQWTAANIQTCNYLYDDLARLNSENCGSAWNQTFSYDPFGNISKSGSQSFGPTYNSATNQYTAIGPVTPTYDANGNLTYDGFHHYGWDAEGKMQKLDTVNTWAFDALGRWAEASFNGTPVQAIYDPLGVELVLATSGRTLADARVPLVGGAMAKYANTALSSYWHPDWLGTSRMESTPSQTVSADAAYAPFGEKYLPSNSIDDVWTGSAFQDKATDLWDFAAREYHPTQGRWVSPDPAGIGAVDPSNPQSWNRYGYGLNNPCGNIDPLGLDNCALKIAINNRAGANLAAVEAQINLILGASPSNGTDSVNAVFVPAKYADYTLDIVSSGLAASYMNLRGANGLTWLGTSYVSAAALSQSFSVLNSTLNQIVGTVATHELTHLITGIGDLPYAGGPNGTPNLMQTDSYSGQVSGDVYNNLFLDPYNLRLSATQYSALYGTCVQRQQLRVPTLGGGGNSGSGAGAPGDKFGWLYLYFAALNLPYL
jgi:RHS repeat-associated protein